MPVETEDSRYYELLAEGINSPDAKKILVEGDSWVSHPQLANLTLKFEQMGRGDFNILNIAEPGDEARDIFRPGTRQRWKLDRLVRDESFGFRFDLIFLSAGGNDIVGGDLLEFLHDKRERPDLTGRRLVRQQKYRNHMKLIAGHYRDFLTMLRGSDANAHTPVVTHTYSYLEPRQKGTHILSLEFGRGWIDRHLETRHITDIDEKRDIVRYLLDAFYRQLTPLEQEFDHFAVADTRTVLLTDDGLADTALFHDEIHPNSRGFERVARVIRETAEHRGLWPG